MYKNNWLNMINLLLLFNPWFILLNSGYQIPWELLPSLDFDCISLAGWSLGDLVSKLPQTPLRWVQIKIRTFGKWPHTLLFLSENWTKFKLIMQSRPILNHPHPNPPNKNLNSKLFPETIGPVLP